METAERDTAVSLELLEQLANEGPARTRFFNAVRLLERLTENKPRIGGDGPFSRESIRFVHQSSLMSQPNEISTIRGLPKYEKGRELSRERWAYEICACILGLTGTDSPLPLYFVSEFVMDDPEAELQRDFLDVFHNRLLALFYRGVNRYDFASELNSDASDEAAWRALEFGGFDIDASRDRGATRLQLLHVAGLFAGGPPTPRSLRNALRALLGPDLHDASLDLREFTGTWVPLDEDQCNRLGRQNNESGVSFVIGTRVRHPAHEARVVVGPLTPQNAQRFSPGGAVFGRVASLVDTFCPALAVVKLELHVRTRAFPPFVLGRRRIARDACITARRDRDDSVTVTVHDLPRVGEAGGARGH